MWNTVTNEAQFITASKKYRVSSERYIRVLMFGVQPQLVVTNRTFRFHTCTTLNDLIHFLILSLNVVLSFGVAGRGDGW